MSEIIRFDRQSAFDKNIDDSNPKQYVKDLGMKVIKGTYSSYGACFFFEVDKYKEDPNGVLAKVGISAKEFDWNV